MWVQEPWMTKAWEFLGLKEIPGPLSEEKIEGFHATTQGGASPDNVSWCSSFVNTCIILGGYTGSNSKAARSWLDWGKRTAPTYGAVTVFWRESPESWKGHVGFLVGLTVKDFAILGGNQSNEVRVSRYPRSRLLGCRFPANYPTGESHV